jgi:antitoxin CptB|tara:strand:- start:44 stop:310 length:267 start_codon:yes stop_codon:yes gene_type:complete
MIINIEDLKKKIIYRSSYRGTKEMDTLLSSFTKKYINSLNYTELKDLLDILNLDDETLYKFNMREIKNLDIPENKVATLFKNFILYDN